MRSSLLRLSPLLVVLAVLLPARASAQEQPNVPGCQVDCYGVTVSPDNSPLLTGQNTSGEAWFSVSNTRQNSDTYTLTCSAVGGVVCDSIQVQTGPLLVANPAGQSQAIVTPLAPTCPPSCGGGGGGSTTATVSLAGGASASVQAWYHVTTTSGTLTLNGSSLNVSDDGFYNVMILLTPTGPLVARDLCLTIAAGPSAAYECGDLRIVHALPSIRTVSKLRTPMLLYNSQHAYPFPSLNADLTLAANDRPDSIIVTARLKVAGSYVQRDRRAWAGSQWGTSGQAATRRVMTNFPASDLATGLYPFQLELGRFVSSVGYTAIRTDTGTVALVNRFASPFGAGWWLAGFEQLQFLADNSIMWIGGDGSVRRYVGLGAWTGKTWYVARPLDGPDTLSFSGATYTRYLPGGARVLFNTAGFHIQTVSRLGYATVFAPDGSNRLSTITVPPPSGSGRTYTFTYAGPNGTLSSVASPDSLGGSSRTTTITGAAITGGARISAIADPGIATSVQFVYGWGTFPGAITGRTDRRGATTSYVLGTGLKLVGTSLPVPGAQAIAQTFCPAETRFWACGAGLTAPESTYAIFDGPRTDSADVNHFWLDSLGAVTRIRDPYNALTTIDRTDPRWPGLATRLQSPVGRILGATYDTRGNLAAVADSNPYSNGQHPTTRYEWDGVWDQLTRITVPNGQFSQFGVDPGNGNRLWAEDRRGIVSRTTFQYYAAGNGAGLLSTVIPPIGARTTVTYDGRGNTASVLMGGWTTFFQNDSLGRNKVTRTPISLSLYRSDTTTYDLADRPVRSASYAPIVSGAPAGLTTIYNFYDDESNRFKVQRIQNPDLPLVGWLTTQWIFDAANRPVVEIAPDTYRDSTWYDPAGNVVSRKTRNGHFLSMVYDRMNRLRRRATPAATYPVRTSPGYLATQIPLSYDNYPNAPHPYPWFPNNGTGLLINADADTFAYDAGGRVIAADNGDARVRRTYFKNGNVLLDSLYIRNYASSTFGHAYGLRYTYDVNGRPTALRHPAQLATGTGMRDSVRYVYNDTTGAIALAYSLLNTQTGFLYDRNGHLVRTTFSGGIVDSLVYDSLGRMTLDRIANGSFAPTKAPDPFLRHTALRYDADPWQVTAALNIHGWKDTVTASYSGLGYLTFLGYSRPQDLSDSALYVYIGGDRATQSFTHDPLGNAYSTATTSAGNLGYGSSFSQGSNGSSQYTNGTGRISQTGDVGGNRQFVYDSAGNTVFFYQSSVPGNTLSDRASWYGADGRLRVAEARQAFNNGNWTNPGWKEVFEEYRYDALGRRVLVMSRQECWIGPDSVSFKDCQMSRIRRTVWDGSRELWEIQMPARAGDVAFMENDTATVTYWAGPGVNGKYFDMNPQFGRLAYTYAGGVDQPLSITRLKLVRRKTATDTKYWNPIELRPHWNWRGEAELGTFADGGMVTCTDGAHCVFVQWRSLAFATGLTPELLANPYKLSNPSPYGWFGTLITSKADGTGTFYRRNRFVDPMTGRFTQEDPIGLAGGLNLYGYANGDPVNYSDPFGLAPCKVYGNCTQSDGGASGLVNPLISGALESPLIGEDVLIPFKAKAGGALLAGVLSRIGINRLSGKAAEMFLARAFGGRASSLLTSAGWRVVDNLTAEGVAMEAKVGRTFLTGRIRGQLAKDLELMNTAGSGVTSVEWHFFQGLTGTGPSKALREALEGAGIRIVEH